MIEMDICPVCGVRLAAPLVAAILDPFRSETCPRYRPRRYKTRTKVVV
jgi:hypothetical protein